MRKGKRLRQPQRRYYDPASKPAPPRIVAFIGEPSLARVAKETRQLRRARARAGTSIMEG